MCQAHSHFRFAWNRYNELQHSRDCTGRACGVRLNKRVRVKACLVHDKLPAVPIIQTGPFDRDKTPRPEKRLICFSPLISRSWSESQTQVPWPQKNWAASTTYLSSWTAYLEVSWSGWCDVEPHVRRIARVEVESTGFRTSVSFQVRSGSCG